MTPACIAPQLKAIRYSTGIWNFGNDGYIRQEAAHVSTADAASDPAGADGRAPPFRDDDQQRIPARGQPLTLIQTQTHSTPQTPRFTFPDEAAVAAPLLWNPENTYCTTVVYTRAGSPFSPLPSHATPGHPHPIHPSLPPIAAHKPPNARPPCSCARGARTTTATNGRGRQRHTTTYGEKGRREDTTRRRPSPPGRGYGRERGGAGGG